MNVIHTISPGAAIPEGYFDSDNITFIQVRIAEILSHEYVQEIVINRADIIRIMQRVLTDRRENIPKLNQRVIMTICNDFRVHQLEANRNYNFEEGYTSSQRLIDYTGGTSKYDQWNIKLKNQAKYDGKERVGGSLRFYYT